MKDKIKNILIKNGFAEIKMPFDIGLHLLSKDGLEIAIGDGGNNDVFVNCRATYTPWTSTTYLYKDKTLNTPSEANKTFDKNAKIPEVEKLAKKLIIKIIKQSK